MHTSLAILALLLGCVGCQQKQTTAQQVAPPAPEPGERPSFYDSNNIAEYYGRCPKCQRWVKGYYSNMTFADASGKLVGCLPGVTGTCEHCKVSLLADESGSLTNESRIVHWRTPAKIASDQTYIGLAVTNVGPIVFPK